MADNRAQQPELIWQDRHQSELSPAQLYAVLALRNAVFVVEQHCPYQDLDGTDLQGANRHIIGYQSGEVVAYARILAPDTPQAPVTIGRVIIALKIRGLKMGHQLMSRVLLSSQQHWPDRPDYLSAQAHLQTFYAGYGFSPVTEIYDEDGIPHIGMLRN